MSFQQLGLVRPIVAWVGIVLTTSFAASEHPSVLHHLPNTIGDVSVSIPEPSMPDGLDQPQQASVLKTLAGKYSLDRFTKNSIVSPFTLQRATVKDANGQRVGHKVDLCFVAYGRLDAIRDEEMFFAMLESKESDEVGDGKRISDEELAQRGIKKHDAASGAAEQVAYYRFSVPVLDRVIVEGVVRRDSLGSDESQFACITLEDAFDGDFQYPNRWRHSTAGAADSVSYAGAGGYAKATRLLGYEGAILIECHGVIHEPQEWFGGANLLGSKLPIAIQDTVRSFRRSLAKQR